MQDESGRDKHKVLIIKVGYSETLDPGISNLTSYGDVLRSTVLLHLYKEDHVTWLVDENAYPILKNNPYIDNILVYNLTSVLQLQSEHFDTVINLEKVPGLCALADSVHAWRRYGFRFDTRSSQAEAYDGTHIVLDICKDIEKRKHRNTCWEEGLYKMVGAEWKGESYVLGYQPKSEVKYDIGFNHQVGTKWPLKAWPMECWKDLETIIGDKYIISWQQGLSDIEEYFEWIHSCKLVVTNDSLGMHLAIAMGKRIVAIFGASPYKNTHLFGLGTIFYPENFVCDDYPCTVDRCPRFPVSCMSSIRSKMLLEEIQRLLKESADSGS